MTTVGPPLSDHSKCEVLMVNYGTVLLTDLLFGGNLLHAISKVRYKSFHDLTESFSYVRIQRWKRSPYAKWSLIICVQSTFALRTPRYNGHPDNTDSSQIPGKNKLQTFDWNKLLPLLWTLVSEDTNSRSLTVSAITGVNWSPLLLEFCSPFLGIGNVEANKMENTNYYLWLLIIKIHFKLFEVCFIWYPLKYSCMTDIQTLDQHQQFQSLIMLYKCLYRPVRTVC